jgi:uncharacterized protein (DUF58 family)
MYQRSVLYFLIFLLVLALLFRLPLLALLCTLLIVAGGVAWLWNRWALVRLDYSCAVSAPRAFPGDEVELQIRVVNRKPLPLALLRARELIPEGLSAIVDAPDRDFHGRQVLRRAASLSWYESLTWRYQLRCHARGSYRFGPATLEAGDPFGFFRSVREEPLHARLIVFPTLLPLAKLGLPATRPIGALRSKHLIRDPQRTVGVRDYTPDDPIKDIHWSATARVGLLQTRVYEPSTDRSLAIFLDLDTFERYWEGIDPRQVERLISAAATLARAGADEGYAVGLYVNGAPVEHQRLTRLPPSRSPAQLPLVMEVLAGLTAYSITPMARLLRASASKLSWGVTLLLVSAIAGDDTKAALLALREHGRSIVWLYLGEGRPPVVPGVAVHHAPPESDWRK